MSGWECPVPCSERPLKPGDEPRFESLHGINDVDASGLDRLTKEVGVDTEVNPGAPT